MNCQLRYGTDKSYAPFIVVAIMESRIVDSQALIHLDGQLAQAAYRDLDERTRLTIPPVGDAETLIDLELPLSRWYRRWFGVELQPSYGPLIRERTAQCGLFGQGGVP
jgi:hypothetical protein